ncbi:hypothetical protein MMC23_003731 [Neofusicoccum parvum]|uniref:Uncharacterized protein n=1 Tax=Neofusicoccum parvum TaxID=310453 RepID=A0ACB5SQ98_9PEZI|nr:hypothetical protein MMC23_003731 [Neofusicoccum parvum]GME66059.1 hypothetical protein MMC23_003731 [Neofusicoccum parvum]
MATATASSSANLPASSTKDITTTTATPTSAAHDLFDTLKTDEPYWANYLLARPTYSPSFYALLNAYRAASSPTFDLAHDIGTGPGQVARELATTLGYAHVIASDASAAHVAVAGRLHRDLVDSGRLSLHAATGEEVADAVDGKQLGAADAVFCAEAIPLMDAERAVDGFARLLRRGGVAAAWFYGRPFFAGEEGFGRAGECDAVYARIVNRLFKPMIAALGQKERKGWLRATGAMHSWLDSVAFPADVWERVERRKWNGSRTMDFYDLAECGVEVEPVSAVRDGEMVEEVEDPGFWQAEWTAGDVRRFIEVNLPKFWEGKDESRDEELEALYGELEKAMGGPDAKRKIGWPVVLLLATKK